MVQRRFRWRAGQIDGSHDDLSLSLAHIIPNALTLMGLCAGATAIRFAFMENWKSAVGAIFCAMVFDMLDGRAARMFRTNSKFGAYLDSLADLVSFGLAPAVVVYMWSLSRLGDAGWIVALTFCVGSAIRLARFNVIATDDDAPNPNYYFVGLPTPAAAYVALVPLMLAFEFADEAFRAPMLSVGLIIASSLLMVSRVPTPSLKGIKVKRAAWPFVGLGVAILFVPLAVYEPWAALLTGIALYFAAMPFVIAKSNRDKHDDLDEDDDI